jgi:release factor glutamine methyltransferase
LEAELLLAEIRRQNRAGLLSEPGLPVEPEELSALEDLVARRLSGEPVAYLLGRREFMSLEFAVGPGVLVPRPETELLVERALELLRQRWQGRRRRPVVVDVGTGCGNIALSLAHYFPRARVAGTDISPAALRLAGLNARRLGLLGRVRFCRGDLLRPLRRRRFCGWGRVVPSRLAAPGSVPNARAAIRPKGGEALGKRSRAGSTWGGNRPTPLRADLVVANLPYIPTALLEQLSPEVQHEPRLALDGGPDGLFVYRRLFRQVGGFLRPGGYLILEMSPEQESPLRTLMLGTGFRGVAGLADGTGRLRVLIGRFFPGQRRERGRVCSNSR